MDKETFEGTLVLERLAEIGSLDEFYEAIDADDFKRARALMKEAGLDDQMIATVLQQMAEADGTH